MFTDIENADEFEAVSESVGGIIPALANNLDVDSATLKSKFEKDSFSRKKLEEKLEVSQVSRQIQEFDKIDE